MFFPKDLFSCSRKKKVEKDYAVLDRPKANLSRIFKKEEAPYLIRSPVSPLCPSAHAIRMKGIKG